MLCYRTVDIWTCSLPPGSLRTRNECLHLDSDTDIDSGRQVLRDHLPLPATHEAVHLSHDHRSDLGVQPTSDSTLRHVHAPALHGRPLSV